MAVKTLKVTTNLDQSNQDLNDGLSLREAIITANQDNTNEYIIELSGGTTYFSRLTGNDDNGLVGDLDTRNNITIVAVGNSPALIDASPLTVANSPDKVFYVREKILTLDNITVTGGNARDGGGIYVDGGLNLNNSTVINNKATEDGGGIYSNGTINISNSTITQNSANADGGGILQYGPTANIYDSTIDNNVSLGNGGGNTNRFRTPSKYAKQYNKR